MQGWRLRQCWRFQAICESSSRYLWFRQPIFPDTLADSFEVEFVVVWYAFVFVFLIYVFEPVSCLLFTNFVSMTPFTYHTRVFFLVMSRESKWVCSHCLNGFRLPLLIMLSLWLINGFRLSLLIRGVSGLPLHHRWSYRQQESSGPSRSWFEGIFCFVYQLLWGVGVVLESVVSAPSTSVHLESSVQTEYVVPWLSTHLSPRDDMIPHERIMVHPIG